MLAMAYVRIDGSKVSESKGRASFDSNAGCDAPPAPDAPSLCCNFHHAAEHMKAKGKPRPDWCCGGLEPRAKTAENKAKTHAKDEVFLYVSSQPIPIFIDDLCLQLGGENKRGSNVAEYAVNDCNYLHE